MGRPVRSNGLCAVRGRFLHPLRRQVLWPATVLVLRFSLLFTAVLLFRPGTHCADLVVLHLLQSPKLDRPIIKFPATGANEVHWAVFTVDAASSASTVGRVHINATQYFGGIPADVWAFCIGGYQVSDNWLKGRKDRTLDYADIRHYQKNVVTMSEPILVMGDIDQNLEAKSGWVEVFECEISRALECCSTEQENTIWQCL